MSCMICHVPLWIEYHIGAMHSINWITSCTPDLNMVFGKGLNIQRVWIFLDIEQYNLYF